MNNNTFIDPQTFINPHNSVNTISSQLYVYNYHNIVFTINTIHFKDLKVLLKKSKFIKYNRITRHERNTINFVLCGLFTNVYIMFVESADILCNLVLRWTRVRFWSYKRFCGILVWNCESTIIRRLTRAHDLFSRISYRWTPTKPLHITSVTVLFPCSLVHSMLLPHSFLFTLLCRSLPSVPSLFLLVFLFILLPSTPYISLYNLYIYLFPGTHYILDRPDERRDDTTETVSSTTLERDTHSKLPLTVMCSWSYQSEGSLITKFDVWSVCMGCNLKFLFTSTAGWKRVMR